MTKPIPILTLESQIKREFRRHLGSLGFIKDSDGFLKAPASDKDAFRALHFKQREEKLESHREFLSTNWDVLKSYFANGEEVDPLKISPRIERVYSNTWQSDLFRFASLTWSVPVSSGYGRRLRFLVWDESNDKLIGIFALGDAVFNLSARDKYLGWDTNTRKEKLVNLLDAYVLGAVAPYNALLGGKLIACLTNSKEVQDEFHQTYGSSVGIISSKQKNAQLTVITTSSSMGRSSIYNRLSLNGRLYFKSIGYTKGWGHFHIPSHLFELMRNFLVEHGHRYASNHSFGDGPNWKLRTVKEALKLAGINPDLIKHGIAREVFVSVLADNGREFIQGKEASMRGQFFLSVKEIGDLARERWIVPRAIRIEGFRNWNRDQILEQINGNSQVTRLGKYNIEDKKFNIS